MDAVRSGIVVYGGGDIVFGAKRSNRHTVSPTAWGLTFLH